MRQIDFEHGGIAQNILKAALPMLVAQVLNLLYNIVDRIYIARIPDIGTAALGAVGLCFPIIVIITAFSNLFGSGGAPLFAIARGSGDKARAGLILNLACTLLLCCAGVLMVIGLLFARPILVLFGASPEALQYALPYLMLYLLGTYPSMLTTGLNPFINAQGYATAGMLSVVIGAAANLVLDPVFIFVLGMGIRGAAAATVLSQLLSAAFVVYFLRCKSEYRVQPLPLRQLPANRRCIGDIVSLGTAGFIMQLTNSVVTICCNNVLSVTGGDVSADGYGLKAHHHPGTGPAGLDGGAGARGARQSTDAVTWREQLATPASARITPQPGSRPAACRSSARRKPCWQKRTAAGAVSGRFSGRADPQPKSRRLLRSLAFRPPIWTGLWTRPLK